MKHITRFLRTLGALVLLAALVATANASVPIPLPGNAPVPPEVLRRGGPNVLPLAGPWRFKLTHGAVTPDGFQGAADGPATASSAQNGRAPNDALPGVGTDKGWCASGPEMPQSWQVDLGKSEDVRGLTLQWEFDDATYQFKVEGSEDAKRWTLLADKTAAPGAHSGPVAFTPRAARFLRVTVVGAHRTNGMVWAC
ncbi:MAG: discoidin domain-containing protein, partial [Armatimonadota bacterium]|nr:discoidin domain-containing protein [Armatimonadota bacterium]